jgi:hypothetical protein
VADVREACPDCAGAILSLCRCRVCGEAILAGVLRQASNTLHLRQRWSADGQDITYKFARLSSGSNTSFLFDLSTRRYEDSPGAAA